jgi:hypothetical protein
LKKGFVFLKGLRKGYIVILRMVRLVKKLKGQSHEKVCEIMTYAMVE